MRSSKSNGSLANIKAPIDGSRGSQGVLYLPQSAVEIGHTAGTGPTLLLRQQAPAPGRVAQVQPNASGETALHQYQLSPEPQSKVRRQLPARQAQDLTPNKMPYVIKRGSNAASTSKRNESNMSTIPTESLPQIGGSTKNLHSSSIAGHTGSQTTLPAYHDSRNGRGTSTQPDAVGGNLRYLQSSESQLPRLAASEPIHTLDKSQLKAINSQAGVLYEQVQRRKQKQSAS